MDYLEAKALRVRQLQGKPVDPKQLAQAIEVLQANPRLMTVSQHIEIVRPPRPPRPHRVYKKRDNLKIPVLTEQDPAELAEVMEAAAEASEAGDVEA